MFVLYDVLYLIRERLLPFNNYFEVADLVSKQILEIWSTFGNNCDSTPLGRAKISLSWEETTGI